MPLTPTWEETEEEAPTWESTLDLEAPSGFSPESSPEAFESLRPSLIRGQPSFTQITVPESPREFVMESRDRQGPQLRSLPPDYVGEEIPDSEERAGAIPRFVAEVSHAPVGLGVFSKVDGQTIKPGISDAGESPEGRRAYRVGTPTSEFIAALPEGRIKDLSSGAYNAAANVFNFFLSPAGIGTLGIGSLPAAAQRTISAGFAVDMAMKAPDELAAGDEAYQRGDIQAATEHWLGGIASLGFAAGAGRHAVRPKPPIPPVIPLERAELPENIGGAIGGASENLPAEARAIEASNKATMRADFQKALDAQAVELAKQPALIKETGGVTSDPLTAPVIGEQPLVPTPGKPAEPKLKNYTVELLDENGKSISSGNYKHMLVGQDATSPAEAVRLVREAYTKQNPGETTKAKVFSENETQPETKPAAPVATPTPATPVAETVRQENLRKQALAEVERQRAAAVRANNAQTPETKPVDPVVKESLTTELQAADNFAGKASNEAEKAVVAWATHIEDVVNPLKKQIRQVESEVQQMAGDARRTKPEARSSQRWTKKKFFEQYGVSSMEEANTLYKKKNAEWAELEKQLESAEAKRRELETVKERRAKEWSSAATRAGELRRQVYPKIKEGDVGTQPVPKPAETAVEGDVSGAIATPGPPLTPAATGSVSLPPKSQRQIITDLAKGIKIPIRFGRLTTNKFAGYFKRVANLVGSKRANDIPIVSHEVGHKLDSVFNLSGDAILRAELDVLGDPATPGSRSSWTKSKTRKYKMGEGVAEFVRHWLTDPAKASKDAPNTYKAFESMLSANKDFSDVMRQAQEDIRVWREAEPQARLRSHISTSNPNKTRYTLSQLTRDVVDDLHILRLAVEDAKKTTDLPPSKDPYLAARNLRGSYGMAETFIRNGVTDFKTKSVKLGTSLEDALKPVSGRLSDFRDWIVAKRAQELRGQGKETGLVPSDVDAVASKFSKEADFQKAFDDLKAWSDATLEYAVDAGLITSESAAAMRKMNQDYVPFHRLFEVGAGEAPSQTPQGIGMGLNVGKPGSFKGLKGSTREIVDPIETMIKNAYTIITASEKAAINRSVAEMANLPDMGKWVERVATPKEGVRFDLEQVKKQLEDAGADLTGVPDDLILSFFRQSGRAPFGENIIRVIRDGKPEFYRLDRDLHDTFQALDLEDSGKLVRILSAPAQLLRAGVVLEPSFNVANALRDTFSAAVIGKYGALPFETTMKGVAAMIKNPQAVAEWAAAGGKNSVEANYFDRTKMQNFLREKISKDLTPAERALIVSKSPLTALRWLTSKAEEATRIGEYQIAYKKLTESGMPPGEARRLAAFEARDRQDFAKGGAKTKIIRHMSAFWNAALQANVKLAQSFKNRPIRTILQGLAFVTIPKLLEQAVNWDDEDYWNRPQWERDLFFLIPIGNDETGHTRFMRLPTPFEVGIIFGTFPGRLLQWAKTNKPESVADFPAMMLKQSVPNPIPQTLNVVFEDFLSGEKGWDIWRGRTIVPESLADLPADLQWTEQTSGVAKEIGKRLNFSPMKVDHIIERTTGGIGKLATGRQVPGQRFVSAPLRVSNQPVNDFYEKLEKLRETNARSKVDKSVRVPSELKAFESTAKAMSELRNKARVSTSEALKAKYQEQIYNLARKQLQTSR